MEKIYQWNPEALNKCTPEKRIEIFNSMVERLGKFVDVLDALQKDNHYWSTRPCPTCDKHSRGLGFDLGCTKYRKERL